jgi:hypothetical protein
VSLPQAPSVPWARGRWARERWQAVGGRGRLALLVAMLVLLPGAATSGPAVAAAQRIGLVAVPQPITELALDQHQALWTVVDPAGRLRFSFTARNASAQRRPYRWDVVAVTGTLPPRALGSGHFELAGGAATSVPVTARVTDCRVRTQVVVSLSSAGAPAGQRLSFWVEPASSPLSVREGRPTCGH